MDGLQRNREISSLKKVPKADGAETSLRISTKGNDLCIVPNKNVRTMQ